MQYCKTEARRGPCESNGSDCTKEPGRCASSREFAIQKHSNQVVMATCTKKHSPVPLRVLGPRPGCLAHGPEGGLVSFRRSGVLTLAVENVPPDHTASMRTGWSQHPVTALASAPGGSWPGAKEPQHARTACRAGRMPPFLVCAAQSMSERAEPENESSSCAFDREPPRCLRPA